jgi:hypothetical protein
VHLLIGIIASARGDGKAEPSFRKALALEPTLVLPPSAGPHVAAGFARARESLANQPPLRLTVEFAPDANPSNLLVDVKLAGNAEDVVHRLVVRGEGLYDVRLLREPGLRVVETLPSSPRCITLEASALDEHGNELWPALARTTSCQPASPGATEPPATSRPIPNAVLIGGALTGGLGVATIVLGVLALDRRHDFNQANGDPARTPDDRKELRELALAAEHRATIAGIATLAGATVTAAIYLMRPTRSGAGIGVGPSLSTRGVVLSGTFE